MTLLVDGAGHLLCPYCSKKAKLVTMDKVYGERFADKGNLWRCKPCDAWVGCHGTSEKTKGNLANSETRSARKAVHVLLDPLWKSNGMSRSAAYRLLASRMGLEASDCHVAHFDLAQCERALACLAPGYTAPVVHTPMAGTIRRLFPVQRTGKRMIQLD